MFATDEHNTNHVRSVHFNAGHCARHHWRGLSSASGLDNIDRES